MVAGAEMNVVGPEHPHALAEMDSLDEPGKKTVAGMKVVLARMWEHFSSPEHPSSSCKRHCPRDGQPLGPTCF